MKSTKLLPISIFILLFSYFNIYSQDTSIVEKKKFFRSERELEYQRYIQIAYSQEVAENKYVKPGYLKISFGSDYIKSPICLEFGINAALQKGADSVYEKYSFFFTPCFKTAVLFGSEEFPSKIGFKFGSGLSAGSFKVTDKTQGYLGINAIAEIFFGFTPEFDITSFSSITMYKGLTTSKIGIGISCKFGYVVK